MSQAAQPAVAAPAPAPAASPGEPQAGPFSDILGRLGSAGRTGDGADAGREALLRSALPALALAGRRLPVGLALVGVIAAGVALANPKSRARILAAGRTGLAALRR